MADRRRLPRPGVGCAVSVAGRPDDACVDIARAPHRRGPHVRPAGAARLPYEDGRARRRRRGTRVGSTLVLVSHDQHLDNFDDAGRALAVVGAAGAHPSRCGSTARVTRPGFGALGDGRTWTVCGCRPSRRCTARPMELATRRPCQLRGHRLRLAGGHRPSSVATMLHAR